MATMTKDIPEDPLDRGRFPVDPWRFVETDHYPGDLGLTETLFAVSNGYLGMRGNPAEGRDAHAHGTFINGFHETWPIQHAESAFGFARTGQTIVNVPDVKVLKLYVDDEPLNLGTADLEHYERSLDFASGVLSRTLVWRTPAGKRVRVVSTRMVSMTERHLALLSLEVTMLDGDAPIVISSQMLNRQDGKDEYHVADAALGEGIDPRKAAGFDHRVLLPRAHYSTDQRMMLGYVCARSRMTVAVAADHVLTCDDTYEIIHSAEEDSAKYVVRVDATEGNTVTLEKAVAYHSSRGVPVRELSDRCDRTLDRVRRIGIPHFHAEQRAWYDRFWADADIEVEGHPELQQAIRFNLFQLAQASARADQQGIPAKGVTGSGYEGHYFWDTEIYVLPFLTYTQPDAARNALHFRCRMLPAARERAREMAQEGALFPWRTINGEEASAYYAAGTAQVHIDADISYALSKYVDATGDSGFLVRDGIDILVETARMWADLGFWRTNGAASFHIHGVTGPDEYTTVVNNNLFTNVMARYNLEQAVQAVREVAVSDPAAYTQIVARTGLQPDEVEEWARCAAGMTIPVRRDPRHPPAGRALPRPRGVGPLAHADRAASAAAALPPAGDLPVPGAQAGRRRAGAVPPGRPVHAGGEEGRLRLLRPHHDGRLHALGGRAVGDGGRGGLPRGRDEVLPLGALRGPRRPARQHGRRPPRRVDGRCVADARVRVRRHARPRRTALLRPAPAGRLAVAVVPAALAGRHGGHHRHPGDDDRRGPRRGGHVPLPRARDRPRRPPRSRRRRRPRRPGPAHRRPARRPAAHRRPPRRRHRHHRGRAEPRRRPGRGAAGLSPPDPPH
ncbi:trehalose/maltose hydrolase-like predicted phosphorylase [Nocardioides zeae]|uniref:Trehalose/maltose hydrolase-like predicted phosphorylase n=1 Tax=Nocardioides zeae TaxID=1457234 RepID=A0AAJ1TZ55_9ACTN|nr:trehalose/maltose hydrolase-like predicted phosphorylase [Nocardioides zeae]